MGWTAAAASRGVHRPGGLVSTPVQLGPTTLAAPDTSPRWLTQREVAALLGYSPRQVRRLIVAGLFPEPIRVLGPTSHPRWLATTVEAWMAASVRAYERTRTA